MNLSHYHFTFKFLNFHFLYFLFDVLGHFLLLKVLCENYRIVLLAEIGALVTELSGVVNAKEVKAKVLEGHYVGVKCYLDDLYMTKDTRGKLFVSGVIGDVGFGTHEAYDCLDGGELLVEEVLNAPVASGSKGGLSMFRF